MAKATPEQTQKANRAALVVAVVVAAFAVTYIGVIMMLDSFATSMHQQEVAIPEETEEPVNPFYVLLIGSDTRKGTALYTGRPTEHGQVDQRSDVMTLVRVDPKKYTVSLLTIPRDTVLGEGGEKINSALLEDDPEQVVEIVYELTGLRADYYMLTTFGMFADLIDAIGGVTVDVPVSVKADDPTTGGSIELKAGKAQKLDGAHALALARARTQYDIDQDALRQSNVRAIEQAIIERMLEGDGIGIEALVVVLENDVKTDMDLSVLGLTVLDFINHAEDITIYSGTGPYQGDIREDDELWVIPNDQETWKNVIDAFKTGKDFSEIVEQPVFVIPPEDSKGASGASSSARTVSSGTAKSGSDKSKSSKSDTSSGSAGKSSASAQRQATNSGASSG